MEAKNVDLFIMTNAKYFDSYQLNVIRERLLALDDSKWGILTTLQFHDPLVVLLVSIIIGPLGIDRFLIGDTGLGLGKLLTCGGLGVWYFVDLFLIMPAAKEKNMQKIMQFL